MLWCELQRASTCRAGVTRRWAEAAAPPKPGTPPATAPPPAAAARPSSDGAGGGAPSDTAVDGGHDADAELPPMELPAEVLEAERAAEEVWGHGSLRRLHGVHTCCLTSCHLRVEVPAGQQQQLGSTKGYTVHCISLRSSASHLRLCFMWTVVSRNQPTGCSICLLTHICRHRPWHSHMQLWVSSMLLTRPVAAPSLVPGCCQAEAAAARFVAEKEALMAALEEPVRLPRIDDFRSKKRRKLLAPAEQVAAKGEQGCCV